MTEMGRFIPLACTDAVRIPRLRMRMVPLWPTDHQGIQWNVNCRRAWHQVGEN